MPHLRSHASRHTALPLLAPFILAFCLLALWTSTARGAAQAAFPDLSLTLSPAEAGALGLRSGGPTRLTGIPAQGLILVLVNYFCPPCHREVPLLKELQRRIRERGLAGRIRLLGLAVGDDQTLVELFLTRHGGLGFPLLPDPALDAHKRLGSPAVPTLYTLVNQGGGRLRLLSMRQGEFNEIPDAFLDTLLLALPKLSGAAPKTPAP